MAVTVLDLVTAALKDLGVLGAGEVPSAADGSDSLDALNRLVDQFAAERMEIYAVTRTTATLTASQASFTVGTGENINIVRPMFLEKVRFQDTSTSPVAEFPLDRHTEASYAAIVQKALTGKYPTSYYYNPTFPLGTLIPWPIPTSATLQWVVYAPTAVPQFAATSTTVSLPPGYARMIVKRLAVELAPSYGKQPDPQLLQHAMDATAVVKRSNKRLVDLTFSAEGLIGGGSPYSIYTGS